MYSPSDSPNGRSSAVLRWKPLKGYLDLCRISNLPTVWTNVLTAVMLSVSGVPWPDFLILLFSMSLFYSGGMCLNDIVDSAVDSIKKPGRPIPSGRIPLRKASVFAGILFALATGLLFCMSFQRAVLAGFLLLAVIVVYDIIHKAHPWTVILMAGCRLMIFVVSSVALTGFIVFDALIAGCIHFVYNIIISVVARHENSLRMPFSFPVIPVMLACICVLDGILMAAFVSPAWLFPGIAGALLTHYGQRFVRGD
jgi:4-hydroxybenzoate polyprenyltransferase